MKRWRMVERLEIAIRPLLSRSRRLRVSVVESITNMFPRAPTGVGWVLAMPTRMVNCVERMPDSCNARSNKRVTARAVLRKLKETQAPVPCKSS